MTNGPHQGGNAAYPVAWNGTHGTLVRSLMTVPKLPKQMDAVTYYLWTDVFFGDALGGRMNQFVPQLLLGSVLDDSSGPPNFRPSWHVHQTWAFGAHYFFEIIANDTDNNNTMEAHAAYGELHPAWPGETLLTTFELVPAGQQHHYDDDDTKRKNTNSKNPKWILTMSVVGDDTRVSTLVVERPYMGMLETSSWTEPPFRNMCINACWELYGAKDPAHLPSGGATYDLTIRQPESSSSSSPYYYHHLYPFTTWERDEGNGQCPSCKVSETHNDTVQEVHIDIHMDHQKEEEESTPLMT
jgi:hypothetical protein